MGSISMLWGAPVLLPGLQEWHLPHPAANSPCLHNARFLLAMRPATANLPVTFSRTELSFRVFLPLPVRGIASCRLVCGLGRAPRPLPCYGTANQPLHSNRLCPRGEGTVLELLIRGREGEAGRQAAGFLSSSETKRMIRTSQAMIDLRRGKRFYLSI